MKDNIKNGEEIFKHLKSKGIRKTGDSGVHTILPKGVFDYLIKEKLGLEPDEYMIIDSDWEGKTLPGDVGDISGAILTKAGKIYLFWTGWDPEKIAPDGSKGYYTLGDNKMPKEHSFFHEADSETYQTYKTQLEKELSGV